MTDFGFAKRLYKPYITYTLCGTPEYISPEIWLNKGYSFEVDWWSLGIIIFEMFTGNPPFVDDYPMQIYKKILLDYNDNMTYPLNKNGKHIISKKGRDFISKLLIKDPKQRLGANNNSMDVMKHSFF
eukprot:311301_1